MPGFLPKENATPRFIIVSQDFSGFGFAKAIVDAGYPCLVAYKLCDEVTEKEEIAKFRETGLNIFQKSPLDAVFSEREKYRDAYWFFDQNHHNEVGETLRKEGFKVWSGSELAGKMEHDRQFGIDLAEQAGIASPPEFEFKDLQSGMDFLDVNDDTAYVFKPNKPDGTWETYVPDSEKDSAANRELCSYLESIPDGNSAGFVLQERIHGVEANFEVWVRNGKPFFAFCDLECKKKLNDDYGPLVGGAQDIGFTIGLESKAVRETVGRLLKLEQFSDYTGFLDMNIIVSEKENYFLEFCARTGYPAHPTLFTALARSPFPEILMEMIDGSEDNFYRHFKYGFAAGITLYTDKRRFHMPIYISEEVDDLFYPYDLMDTDGLMLLSGCGTDLEIGVITGHGYTIKTAAEEAVENLGKVNFPNRSARTDLDKNCYPSAPQARYDALVAMGYFV